MTTLGTHNLLDGEGRATPFANILFFTEAQPFDGDFQGYRVWECPRQRDLVIAYRESALPLTGVKHHYKRAHWGIPKVTPNRGTFWITGRVDGEKVALLDEHRINAAFSPFKRGEGLYRRTMWEMHTRMTLRVIRRLKRRGYTVHAGGDLNAPRGVSGYRGVLNEVGDGLDRLGSTRRLGNVVTLSRRGSDHHRLRATLR